MPFLGAGVHILIALFFAVHVIRSGQNMYWLMILFAFPMLGSAVYFFAIYLPQTRIPYEASKVMAQAAKKLDPGKEMRAARAAFEYTPTAQNQMRLALALLEAGQAQEAVQNYEACLQGPFANDLHIRLGAARACFACGRTAQSLGHLAFIRAQDVQFHAEQVGLLMARSYAFENNAVQAKAEFEAVLERAGSFDAHAEFLIWALETGDTALIARLQAQIDRAMMRWQRHHRQLNADMLQRLKQAQARAAAVLTA